MGFVLWLFLQTKCVDCVDIFAVWMETMNLTAIMEAGYALLLQTPNIISFTGI